MTGSFFAQSVAAFGSHLDQLMEEGKARKTEFGIQHVRPISHEKGEATLAWVSVRGLSDPKEKGRLLNGFLLMLFEGETPSPSANVFVEEREEAHSLFREESASAFKSAIVQKHSAAECSEQSVPMLRSEEAKLQPAA